MAWYWLALIVAAVAPFVSDWRGIVIAFQERGLQTGLGTWFGMAIIPAIVSFGGLYLAHLFLGL